MRNDTFKLLIIKLHFNLFLRISFNGIKIFEKNVIIILRNQEYL